MKFAQVVSPHRLEIAEAAVPEPGDGEILVKVSVCGVDGPTFSHVMDGVDTVYPASGFNNLGLAHEASGRVVAVGRQVKNFAVGNRVSYLGPGFQEYAAVKSDFCGKVPDGVEDLALLGEPMAVMYHTAVRSGAAADQTVAVFGAGYMGLGIIHLLTRLAGPTIVAVETNPKRLSAARSMGAKYLVNPKEEDALEAIRRITGGKGADLAIEATGAEAVLRRIDEFVGMGGTVVLHGWFSGETRLRLGQWHVKDLNLKFSHPAPHEIYGRLIEEVGRRVAEGKIDLKPLITHQIPFADVPRLEQIMKSDDSYIKGVVIL